MITGITVVDFAKLEKCSRQAVYNAIRAGYLSKLPDGTMDPALVGTGWSAKNRNGGGVDGIVIPDGMAPTKADSERRREHIRAELMQIELDEKLASVARISEMIEEWGKPLATLRTRFLAFPAEKAPELHRCKSVAELEKKLRTMIIALLEELSSGGPLQKGN